MLIKRQIRKGIRDGKISLTKKVAKDNGTFCEIWPKARDALTLLETFFKNPIVRIVIRSIRHVGDVMADELCSN